VTLGVRKQVLVDLLRTLVAEGHLGRAGREVRIPAIVNSWSGRS